jgi:hypothetical protein
MIEFLIDVFKIAVCVYVVNKFMFWRYRKTEQNYYKEIGTDLKRTQQNLRDRSDN